MLLTCEVPVTEIVEKLNGLKDTNAQLGLIQDELVVLLDDEVDKVEFELAERWYMSYDKKVNMAIKEASCYISRKTSPIPTFTPSPTHIKFKKLEIPKFDSDPKKFF